MSVLLVIAALLIFGPVIGWLLLAFGVGTGLLAMLIGLAAEIAIPVGVVFLIMWLLRYRKK